MSSIKKIYQNIRHIMAKYIRYIEILIYEFRYLKFNKSNHTYNYQYNMPIVSLTSYGERLQTVNQTILSILDQNLPPKKVILYLGEDIDFDDLPKKLTRLQSSIFEIRLCYPNIKAHKKYFFAMQEYSNDIIVTIDDDIVYRRDTLETLIKGYINYPDCVIAHRVHKINFDLFGNLKPYNDWEISYKQRPNTPSMDLFATGVGAVLYPPHIIPKKAFNIDAIKEYCLYADDIWLKVAQLSIGIPVVYVPNKHNRLLYIKGTQDIGLYKINVNNNQNDIQLVNSMKYFDVTPDKFMQGIIP